MHCHQAPTYLAALGRRMALPALVAFVVTAPSPVLAAWPADPTVNVPVCAMVQDQQFPAVLRDGAGGVFVVWQDYRDSSEYKIYAQRLSANGVPQWGTNGIPICSSSGDQLVPHIATDGAGGAIVTWNDARAVLTDIYAQRLSPGGDLLWAAAGVPLCQASGPQHDETLIPDGAGGAIVVWWDRRDDAASVIGDIYAQRVSASGVVQWTSDGVPICVAAGSQQYPAIAADATGGAIITWVDARNGGTNRDIYAQRIASDSGGLWATNGVALCSAANDQTTATIASDGAGGAIVSWEDTRTGIDETYAQRISPAGIVQWAANGVAVSNGAGAELLPTILADGTGGAIVTWVDTRQYPSSQMDIYAQRLSSAGLPQWGAGGVVVCDFTGDQFYPALTSDGAGGAIVAWEDHRDGVGSDIYARRVTAAGAVLWGSATRGVAISTATDLQFFPVIARDDSGGAIISWQDNREGTTDIYAQRIRSNGQLGSPTVGVSNEADVSFSLEAVHPNPARGTRLSVRFSLPRPGSTSLELLDVAGRRVAGRELDVLGAGRHTLELNVGTPVAPGLYLVRLRQGTNERLMRVAMLK